MVTAYTVGAVDVTLFAGYVLTIVVLEPYGSMGYYICVS